MILCHGRKNVLILLCSLIVNNPVVGLYYLLKKRSVRTQTIVLGILSFSGIAAIIFNLVTWGSPLEYLPFHLCSLNALVLPVAVFTRSKTLGNLLLVWSLGALAALVVNTAQAEYELLSATFAFYFFPHVLEFGIPILLFKLGLVKKDAKCILPTIAITMGSYTLIHCANVLLNRFCSNHDLETRVNYMYSLWPENPLLQLFFNWVPVRYWYMYCIVPIIAVYLLVVYAPQLLRKKKA
jgi:uncharacterized membrane protein YwaF